MSKLSLSLNGTTAATTQYSNFDFNSYTVINGKLYGSSSSGIFLIEGNTDAGTEIDAHFKTFSTDLNTHVKKRLRTAYVSGNSKGSLIISPVLDNDEGKEYSITLEDTLMFRRQKVHLDRTERGYYVGVRVANVDGVDFTVNNISLVIIAVV
jgi:hypothetical protein